MATLHLAYPPVVLPAVADGAPAFLERVTTAGGVKDLLFLTTKSGIVLAIDAVTGVTVWSKQPATGPNYTTSSPAIDPGRQYVYSYGLEGRVHKYQVGDGTEVTTGGWPELVTRKPTVEKGSSALAIATVGGTSYLYVANGGYPGDAGDYQGHVTVINLSTGAQNVFNANCSDQACHFFENGSGGCGSPQPDCPQVQTAIWARAGVVYDPAVNRIFMATGNGTFDANTGGNDWGDSVFALHPDGTGNGSGWPLDSYTPTEYQALQNADADLGSTAPAILPVPAGSTVAHVALQSGKDTKLRLLNLSDLSGQGGPAHVGGELQKINVPQGGLVLTAPAVWIDPADGATWVFVANGNGISGLKLGLDAGNKPQLVTTSPNAWTTSPGGTSPIIANGILYVAASGVIRALEPTTGITLWQDPSLGPIHWESPIVVNGRLYVTDEAAHLLAYEPTSADFYTVSSCRVADTRGNGFTGQYGPPALASGGSRTMTIGGQCGVPAGAVAVVLNFSVVNMSAMGDLKVVPAGAVTPPVASVTWMGTTGVISNGALVGLGTGGAVTMTNEGLSSVDVIVDVNGYFQ